MCINVACIRKHMHACMCTYRQADRRASDHNYKSSKPSRALSGGGEGGEKEDK